MKSQMKNWEINSSEGEEQVFFFNWNATNICTSSSFSILDIAANEALCFGCFDRCDFGGRAWVNKNYAVLNDLLYV